MFLSFYLYYNSIVLYTNYMNKNMICFIFIMS